MIVVIHVHASRVTSVEWYNDEKDAMDYAVAMCQEHGASESEEEIRKELKNDGEYIPSSRPVWSVTVKECKKNQIQ